ncbi:MAG: hypothetical protein QFX33_05045 [Candidatus Nezhaarchaeota archaeon]|nr:hypothetical protein [Candidatus Nezhaarchaeota archaeon]
MKLKRAHINTAMIIAAILLLLLESAHCMEQEAPRAYLTTEVATSYTYAVATYTLHLEGLRGATTLNVSISDAPSLYDAVCGGTSSRFWLIEVPSSASTFNITVKALYLIEPRSAGEEGYLLRLPLNPSVSTTIASVNATIHLPSEIAEVSFTSGSNDINITSTGPLINAQAFNVSPYEVRDLSIVINFNNSALPWLFKVKKASREIYLDSKTVVDQITIEGLSNSYWVRQSIFNFEVPSALNILEVGDFAGPYIETNSHPSFGQFRLLSLNDTCLLQVQPRVSISSGEQTTFYIKYELKETSPVSLMPPYLQYVDEIEVNIRLPEGSQLRKVDPEPYCINGLTIFYRATNISRLRILSSTVEYAPPLISRGLVVLIGFLMALVVGGVAAVSVRSKRLKRKTQEKRLVIPTLEQLESSLNAYLKIAGELWGLREDYVKSRIKEPIYRRRANQLKSLHLEYLKRNMELSRQLEELPGLRKICQKVRSLLEGALNLEEEFEKLCNLIDDKKMARAEALRRSASLKRKAEVIWGDLQRLKSKIREAIV